MTSLTLPSNPDPPSVKPLPAALPNEERLALYLIGKLAMADLLTPATLYGGGNSIESMMQVIAAGIREAVPMLGPGALEQST